MTHYTGELLKELLAMVRQGSPWRDALNAVMMRAGEPAEPPSDEACGNWIWLAALPAWDMAVVLNGGLRPLAAALAPHFAAVCYQDAGEVVVELARLRFAQDGLRNIRATRASLHSLPYRSKSADCIALQEVPAEFSLPDLARMAGQCFRVLRSGGCLCIGWDNCYYYRRLLRAGPTHDGSNLANRIGSARRVTRALLGLGFHTVRVYYASPSHRRPHNIVPAARHAAVAYEQWECLGVPSNRLRLFAARLGLSPYLHASQLVLAYR